MKKMLVLLLTAMLAAGSVMPGICSADETASESAGSEAAEESAICSGEEYDGLVPIGSVVLLKNSEAKLMVMGYCQSLESGEDAKIYDYCGCLFPSGYESPDQVYLFDHEQVESIYFLGYQDEEQMAFMERVVDFINSLEE